MVNIDGRLIGYNTDGRGYLKSLLQVVKLPLADSNILVLGLVVARGNCNSSSKSWNSAFNDSESNLEKAIMIKENDRRYKKRETNIDVNLLKTENTTTEKYDVIINTTSIGMSPKIEEISYQ
ncbi:hypothetical protein KHA80_03885 [Anaerobacillus sp. HL2]|nr:hypothetical protein KHA80_03885 [Anaerobacillus sp. HL2]